MYGSRGFNASLASGNIPLTPKYYSLEGQVRLGLAKKLTALAAIRKGIFSKRPLALATGIKTETLPKQ